MGDTLGQNATLLASPLVLQKPLRDLDVLTYAFVSINGCCGRPTQDQGFNKRRVRDRWMGRSHCNDVSRISTTCFLLTVRTRGHEPRSFPSLEHVLHEFFDDVEMWSPKKYRVFSRPRIGMDDDRGDLDIVIETTAGFAAGGRKPDAQDNSSWHTHGSRITAL